MENAFSLRLVPLGKSMTEKGSKERKARMKVDEG